MTLLYSGPPGSTDDFACEVRIVARDGRLFAASTSVPTGSSFYRGVLFFGSVDFDLEYLDTLKPVTERWRAQAPSAHMAVAGAAVLSR
jgi:hypothetical protein